MANSLLLNSDLAYNKINKVNKLPYRLCFYMLSQVHFTQK